MTLEIQMDILYDVLGTRDLRPGMTRQVPGRVVLELKTLPIENRRVIHDTSPPIPVEVTLKDDSSVAAFVGWLYWELVKFKHRRVVIDGRWVAAERLPLLEAVVVGWKEPIKVVGE